MRITRAKKIVQRRYPRKSTTFPSAKTLVVIKFTPEKLPQCNIAPISKLLY
ncbi:MAG: hypothetical protein ACJASQ_003824 [Crocinitomicaceae bacterium]|jgi:hypothetical protein